MLGELEQFTVRYLELPVVRREQASFVYLLQVLLVLRDEPVWQQHLSGPANGEYELLCPVCGRDLYAIVDASPTKS